MGDLISIALGTILKSIVGFVTKHALDYGKEKYFKLTPVQSAIKATADEFPNARFTEPALKSWVMSDSFATLLEAQESGEKAIADEEIIGSFIDGHGFFTGLQRTDDDARRVLKKFLENLRDEFLRAKDAHVYIDRIASKRHQEVIGRFDNLEKAFQPTIEALSHAQATGAEALKEKLPIFNPPFPRNKFFTGRNDIIEGLHIRFDKEREQALNGMGGIGKTETALEYAYRYREEYPIVLWANANTRETLIADYTKIAGLLNLPEKCAQDQGEIVAAVKQLLENSPAWLLILDNADEIHLVEEFIPSSKTGHILLTTRAHTTGAIAEGKTLEKMDKEEGALFLLRRLRKIERDEMLESAASEMRTQAEALSTMLDGLPLALDQAAAFIEETPSTLEEYQSIYQTERRKLLNRRSDKDKHPSSVTITFSLAFKKVEEANQAAADLLRVCAFLEAEAIPEEIFSDGAKELGEALSSASEGPLILIDAIKEAARFSLLKRQPDDEMLSLHRLVQVVLRDEMDNNSQRMWAERAVHAVEEVFPNVDFPAWEACRRLVPHAQKLAKIIEEFGFEFLEAARMMNQAGGYLNERAQYAEAEPLLQRALAIYKKNLGLAHPEVANVLNNLGGLYYNRGNDTKAEVYWEQALNMFEETLGKEHSTVATSLNNIAVLYDRQGKHSEAKLFYERALDIYRTMLEPEHPDIANTLNNLAGVYYNEGDDTKAGLLWKEALEIQEKKLDKEHPDIANTLNNLAELYQKQTNYIDAEPLYVRALTILEKARGPEHPSVAAVLENYAVLLRAMDKPVEAEKLESRVSNIRAKYLQPDS
jgi:tetratricopeptide (TPR) repeat protein